MKSGEDFKKSAIENNIYYWEVHNCSLCDYECGYMFYFRGCEVVYNSGCDCTRRYVITQTNWDDVANQYNINIKYPETIKKYNELWKFKD